MEAKYGMDLINAILERKEKKVKDLLSCNANMEVMLKGDMAIHLAARYGLLKVIQYLHRAGDDIHKVNQQGNTAIHYAARDGREDIVEYLLQNGADINVQNNDGDTALHYCVGYQPMDVIEQFVALGMNVNKQNNNGDTPLHYAVKYSRDEAVEALLLCDSDPDIKNYHGKRPDQVAKLPSIGETIRTHNLLATAMGAGYIQARGMKIAHTEVEKPKLIDRVELTLKEVEIPTDFPTTFYCRREKTENTTLKISKDEDEEFVSDVFHVRIRDVYRNIDAKLTLPLYTKPTERQQLYVKFVEGEGGKKLVNDVFEAEDLPHCTIQAVLVPDSTCVFVIVMMTKAEVTMVHEAGRVITSEFDADFMLDAPEGAFKNNTMVSVKMFYGDSHGSSEDDDEVEHKEKPDLPNMGKPKKLLSDVYEVNISGEQPAKSIKMQLPLRIVDDSLQDSSDVQIIRVDEVTDDRSPIQSLQIESNIDGKNIVFEASHFCIYVIALKARTDMHNIYEDIMHVKRRKQKARFFAMIRQESRNQYVLLVECNRAKYSRERRKRAAKKGYEKQYPKHSKQISLQPSDEFSIHLEGDAKFDYTSGETGSRRLVFSPHRASYQLYRIELTPHFKDGIATLYIYAADSVADSGGSTRNIMKAKSTVAVAELRIKLHVPSSDDEFVPYTADANQTKDSKRKNHKRGSELSTSPDLELQRKMEFEKRMLDGNEEESLEDMSDPPEDAIVPEGAVQRPDDLKEADRYKTPPSLNLENLI